MTNVINKEESFLGHTSHWNRLIRLTGPLFHVEAFIK